MPTETNVTQERILRAVQESQEATIQAVRRWSEAVATVAPRVPELFFVDRPEQAAQFVSKLWSNQFEYVTRLVEAVTGPLAQGTSEGAQSAASTASSTARAATSSNAPKS